MWSYNLITYIITRGLVCPKTPSKGTMKRKIVKLMMVDKRGETFIDEKLERQTVKIYASLLIRYSHDLNNHDTMTDFDVSRILIDRKSSRNIMYD